MDAALRAARRAYENALLSDDRAAFAVVHLTGDAFEAAVNVARDARFTRVVN